MAAGAILKLYRERGAEHPVQVLRMGAGRPGGLTGDALRAISLVLDAWPERAAAAEEAFGALNVEQWLSGPWRSVRLSVSPRAACGEVGGGDGKGRLSSGFKQVSG
jgi:hypothetical protein